MALADYDSPWKDILDAYFPEFMAFFFPAMAAEIDWSRGYESLDTELQQIVRDAEIGRRLADKLMRLWRLDGTPQMVLVHIEIQGARDLDFPKRLFIYHYRIFDRYDAAVVSLAVLGDSSRKWRPQHYEHSLWGCRVRFEFPIVKLRDYYQRWADLEASANPFAVVVMAHVQMQHTRRQPPTRLQGKLGLIRHLYTRGFTRQIILDVFRFIDWIMTLPTELETQFQVELAALEAETSMPPYVTTIERSGIAKGLQQGLQQGAARVLVRLLTRRFGPLPAWAEERLSQASTQELEHWADLVLDAARLEEVFTPPSS